MPRPACNNDTHLNLDAPGAILVNPWDTEQVTTAMKTALDMDFRDRVRAHDNMVQYVYNFTSSLWIHTFTEQLREAGMYAEVCLFTVWPKLSIRHSFTML